MVLWGKAALQQPFGPGAENVRISTKGRYALRVMVDLAVHDQGAYIPLRDVSGRVGITVKYLEQIIALLNRAGFVVSSRGLGGGYRLARGTEQYTAGEILRAVEGSLAPVACLDEPGACPRGGVCPTLPFWRGLDKAVNDYVDSVTLADLVANLTDSADYCI